MKASEVPLTKFLDGTRQFIIPIYQRTYSWTEKECEKLWNDIIQVAKNKDIPAHFIGSIVYIEKGLYQVSDVPQLLVIDGQQRLTTLTLLLAAFGDALDKQENDEGITSKKISKYFFNYEETGDKHYKLILTQSDEVTLINILEKRTIPEKYSKNIVNNYKFFQNQITKNEVDLNTLYEGIRKLIIVDISLDSNYDNPQLIFESLNSTGLELSQADLIRNYVLMDQEREQQNEIYKNYWYPIEESFGHSEGTEYFDRFMRDYLTIKTGVLPNIRDVYSSFKEFFTSQDKSIKDLVIDIHYFSKFFVKLFKETEEDIQINRVIHNINSLKVDVAYPFLLEVYVDCDKGIISKDELLEIFLLVESYVFRRAICEIPTNSLNKTFPNLRSEIEKDTYVESVKVAFNLKESYRRFPSDEEFRSRFIHKNVYNTTRIRKYILDKLENAERPKERVNVDDFTIEHILPQNKNLSEQWRNKLGENWKEIQEKYLHTIGNLTLTEYNSELSDNSFLEKRDMEGGFAGSPIKLNRILGNLENWNEEEIIKRANSLAEKAIDVWKFPKVSQEILSKHSEIDEDDEEDEEEDDQSVLQWNARFDMASNEVKLNVNSLISKITEKFGCVSEPYAKCLYFYIEKPTERKNMFAIITCGKNVSNMVFRINPDTFKDGDKTRKVAGWWFPRETERRIRITEEDIPQIMHYMEHAHSVTQALAKKRSEAARKAWDTRNS
jgi:uncharacterized protein with ParB-like and HNH nuclease domain